MKSVLSRFIGNISIAAFLAVVFAGNLLAQTTQVKIGSLDLTIGGIQATVTPAQPTIPKNIASGVQIVVTQNGQSLTAAQVAQFLGGPFQLTGQYSGPGLTQTVDVSQTGVDVNSLIIDLPAVSTAGNYTLSNVQFIVNGAPVFDVTPSTITVQVIDQVLVTSVQTTPLTLDQIEAMGVVLDSSAYTGFQFTVGLQFSSQVVNVSFPVVFDPQGVPIPQPLSPPQISPPTGVTVPIPTIVPVLLQGKDGAGNPVTLPALPNGQPIKIPSVIVIPGNVGFLKQFFSAQLYVTNGAPGGSNLSVDNITGTINLPAGADGAVGTADDPLALPTLTSGSQPATMNVLAPPPGGGAPSIDTLNPGDTGQAQWTIRGDKEGYYPINFGINATLNGLPTGPISLTGSAAGAVLVRNPFFDMTFTVPGVVRKGELFNVYATVTNISQVAANNLTVNFDQSATSGVTLVSPPSPVVPTLNVGDSTTLTFQFRSLQTGRAVASYLHFDTNDGTTGNLNFSLGVFANGTPMSPDTLVLPSSVDNLPTDVVDAAMRVLGQAWSVATAPTLPAGVTRTTQNVVNQKALLLAEAGLRQSLGEPLSDALRDLGTDFFSGSPVDPGFDQVLRTTPAGEDFVSVLGANLAQPAAQVGGALTYESQLANIEASGPNFVTFAVGSGSGAAPVSIALSDSAGNQITSDTPGGSILGGAIFPLGSSGNVPYLGLLTSPSNSPYTLLLTGQANGSVDISISIPRGDGTVERGTVSGVQVVPGEKLQVVADFTNPTNLNLQIDFAGSGVFSSSVPFVTQVISPSGPSLISATVIGSETISEASNFGMDTVLLFDRIVDSKTASTVTNYSIPNNAVASASKQLSGRLVFANLAQPEGPYVPTTFSVNGIADQRGDIGSSATISLQSLLQDPGAVVTGHVLSSDGTPSSTAVVTYTNTQSDAGCSNPAPIGLALVPVQSNGTYQFRYVHQDPCGGAFQVGTKDPATGALRQVSTYVRTPGQQMVIDLALLGLGSVSGTVTDLSGNPVYNAQVVAVSVTDSQVGGSTFTDANGNYTINGITVGPITIKAVKGSAVGSSAGNIQRAGTNTVVNVSLNSGAVNVTGTVTEILAGVVTPVPGAAVAYYLTFPGSSEPIAVGVATTGADGSYSISSVPAGSYSVRTNLGNNLQAIQSGVSAAGDNLIIPLQIVVPVTGTVNGKVSFPDGTPAAGVVVYQAQNGVLTNPDGTFSLPGVPVLPSQSQTISAATEDFLRTGRASVVVSSATIPVTANITLSGLGSAQFTVLDPTGKPLAGQQVTLLDGSPNCGGTSQTTNANGIAVFTGLPVGTVRAAALQSHGNSSDLALATATITQDGTTGFATMQFNGSGTVTGNVVDPDNAPVFGAIVQLTSNTVNLEDCFMMQAVTQSVQTGTDGTFHFTGVNVGKVGVTASQAFFPTSVGAQGNLSTNGATVNFPLQLVNTISGVLSGTIFLPDGVTPAGPGIQVIADGPLPNVAVTTDANGNFKFAKIFPQGSYKLTANDPVSGGTNQMQIFLRAGQDMTQNLRLKGTGTVNVTVVDGAGVPVNSAFVTFTETDYPNASFSGSLDASNQGVLPFPNVFEGAFSVKVTDPFGRGGRASGTLPQGSTSVNVQVQLTTTGTVQGHFFMPDGITPIPNANIQLTANGQSIGQATSLGTGDVGSYSFQFVPAGPIQLKGQDPLTGRTGIAAGSITTQGQTLTLDIKAQGLDTVEGLVTSNGAPQPGANVTLVSGNFHATTSADANGMYLMTGVPEGVIVATASLGNGFLDGTASSTISGDGNTLTLNVALRNSSTVVGQVVMADGVTPAPPSTVTINVGGVGGGAETATTDAQGNFTLVNVPAGTGTITAQVLGGIDQARSQINVDAGGITTVQVKLNGTGGLSGTALDSTGNPTAGTITLTGTGTFPYFLTLTAAADGTFSVPQVLAGPFTAKLSANIGGFTLFGTATGSVAAGQPTNITVQVQPSGTITGTVLRPDGQTPAVGAAVKIQLPTGAITVQVQNDGTFTATGVPLGTFNIQINDSSTMGIAAIEGQTISSNGQTINLGTITLDGNALAVVSSNPADGTTGVAVNQPLTITFSESLASTGGIFVSNGASNLFLSTTLSSDGKTVTLQGQLPDGVPLALNATGQVTDIFGRQLLQPQTIHFTTVDLTPPTVVSITPTNLAIQVPTNTTIAVTFNKALSTTASIASVVTVNSTLGPVAGSVALTAPNTLTFTPSAPLMNNLVYSVLVNGAVSFGGNLQTNAFTSSFVSPETTPPVLQMNSPANGAFVSSATPTISISLSDPLTGIAPATASLILDGQAVRPNVGSSFMTFTPSAALTDGTHTITASVQNNAGILGTLSGSFVVDTVPPSAAVLSGITAGQILKGQVAISASATDAISGIAKINLLVDGTVRATLTGPTFSTLFDTATVADGSHSFSVQAVNNAGSSGPVSTAIQAFISNIPLTVTITSPASGTSVGNQVTVTASTSKPVQQVVFSLGSQNATATTSPYRVTLNTSGIAEGAQVITAVATDADGTTATATLPVVIDHTAPVLHQVLIAANPPISGSSVVRGLAGATEAGAQIAVTNTANNAVATATAATDGSFSLSISGAIGDVLSLTATDAAGNTSAPITLAIPQTSPLSQVVQVQPADGSTNFPLNGHIIVRFAQPIPATSVVSGTLTLLQGTTNVVGTVTLSNDGLSLTFAPAQNLASLTGYTVVVEDVANHQTSPLFQSTFTTGTTTVNTAPTVVQTNPQSNATNVPINTAIKIQFSKAMDPSTLTPQTFVITDEQTGQTVPGMVQVDPTGITASFVPSPMLGIGREFLVRLASGIKDTEGNSLSGISLIFTTSFSADTQGPNLIGVGPTDGTNNVPLNSIVTVEFDEPLDVTSVANGFQVQLAGVQVAGGVALSDGNKRITFTPLGGLAANTLYTVVTNSQITDVGGLPLQNPGSFTFTSGSVTDNNRPTVVLVSPGNGAGGVPENVVVEARFSKRIDPVTVGSGTFEVFPSSTGIPVPGTYAVSADGLTATFTPAVPLVSETFYEIELFNGITDLQGQTLSTSVTSFTTGLGTATSGPVVELISPPNGAAGVDANARVDVLLSEAVNAATVGSNAITVTAGGVPVAGTVSVGSGGVVVSFTPSSVLTVSTAYTVTVGGFTDEAGNAVVPFTSSFATGATGTADTTRPAVVRVSPANGTTGVNVNSAVEVTFTEAVDPATVNNGTVQISVNGFTGVLAGSYAVNGPVVTFTPLTPMPGNATITMFLSTNGVTDLAGNGVIAFSSSFTTAAVADTVVPAVEMVTPGDGTSGVGLNAVVVLTFSKSLNANTLNANTFGLLVNGAKLGVSVSRSADNRVVTLSTGTLPGSSVVTVVATSGVMDLSGNALTNFESSFTTVAAFDTGHPAVVSQRPGNGATGVPVSASSVVLYVNEAMNAATVAGALHISQNGVLVDGTVQVTDAGQVIQFTPSAPWQANALVQVFLDGTAQDVDGNSLSSYQGSFTVAADTSVVAPGIFSESPVSGTTGIPTNVVITAAFNEALNAATVNGTTVTLTQGFSGPVMASTVSLLNGNVIQIAPSGPLAANTQYFYHITNGVQGTNGLVFAGVNWVFTTGAGADTVAPMILSVSPPTGSLNVGDNADVRVVFSEPVNPVTVTASTIQLMNGGTTLVPDSISFSNNNQSVLLVPHAPLPDGTAMTVTVSGITDLAGNAVASQTTEFTTGTGPDVSAPVVVETNPFSNAVSVPLNSPVVLQTNEPIDPGTVNGSTFFVRDTTTGQDLAGTYAVSADGQTISFVPGAPLAVSREYFAIFSGGITDLAGNGLSGSVLSNFFFTTGVTANTTAPQVVGVSPMNGLSGVAINAQVVVQFNEPVNAATLGQITLSGGSGNVTVSERLSNANQTLTLVPVVPLTVSTTYTVNVAGVLDIAGNAMPAPFSTSFSTGNGAQLSNPSVLSASPSSGATAVPLNTPIQLLFSDAINPQTLNSNTFKVSPTSTGVPVSALITLTPNGTIATLTPSSALSASTTYNINATSGILDLEGQTLSNFSVNFTTGTGTSSGSNPPSRTVGAVLNTSNPLATDLAGLFLMNEGAGSTDTNLVDGQTAVFSGVNPPAWNVLDPSIVVLGGGSLNSYLNAGMDLTFDQLPTSQITIVAKIFLNSVSTAGICEKNDGNTKDSGFVFGWDGSGAMRLTVEKSTANMRVATAAGLVPSAQWIQVAFTWDGTIGTASAAHLFLNGVELGKATATDGSGTLGFANATNKPFRIGNASFDIPGSLNGKMAYLAVYKGRILTPTEMGALDVQLPTQ